MTNAKQLSFLAVVIQQTSLVLFIRYSKTREVSIPYLASVVVVSAELFKLILNCTLEIITSYPSIKNKDDTWKNKKERLASIMLGLINVGNKESLKLFIPAVLYVIQNNLLFYALSNLSVPTYQITNQGKLLTTAIISRIMLKRKLSNTQYFAIALLGLGVAIVHISEYQANLGSKQSEEDEKQIGNQFLGLLAVFVSCVTSGFCGVYFELLVKSVKHSVYCRNFHLAFYSLFLGLFFIFYYDSDKIQESGMFQGFDKMVFLIVVMQGMTGFVVSMMFKYSTAVLKGFATSIAVVVATIASFFLFDTSLNPMFILGATMVTSAVKLYSTKNDLSSFWRPKYGLMGGIVVISVAQFRYHSLLFHSNPIQEIPFASIVEKFFSPYPYVFTEGCLETFSELQSSPPYQQPRLVGDMHDHPTNLTGVFDVPPDKSFMNTVVIVIDSLSRAQIMAYMPKVRQVLLELHKSGSHDKELFPFLNALALDGTTPIFFSALMSGKEFGFDKERTWMHDELKKKGHVFRYFGRTWPISVTFQQKFPEAISTMVPEGTLHNAEEKPEKFGFTEDYAITYEGIKKLAECENSSFCKKGATEEISLQVEHLRQFWNESINSPKLAILHSVASHAPNRPESVAAYDSEIASLLQDLIKSRNMNIIFVTDHGRLDDEHSFGFPLMAAILCKKALNEERAQNMIHNSKRMVTIFDIHHTLRHLHLGDPDKEYRWGEKREFKQSMLVSKIAKNRTCKSAGVSPFVCPCLAMSWNALTPERELIVKPQLEDLLRAKQQTGCEDFNFQKMIILSPGKPTRRKLTVTKTAFFRAEIHVQKDVIFQLRGYVMGDGIQLNSLKQISSYRKFEVCTPEGGDAQFCICALDDE